MRKTAIVMTAVIGFGCAGYLRAAVADEGVTAIFEKNLTVQNAEKYIQTVHEQAAQEIEKLKEDEEVLVKTDELRESQDQSVQEDMAKQIKGIQAEEVKEHDNWEAQALTAQGNVDKFSKEIAELKKKENESSTNAGDSDRTATQIEELTKEQTVEEKKMKDDEAKAAKVEEDANLQIKVRTAQEVTSGMEAQKEAAQVAAAQKETEKKIAQTASAAIETLQKNEEGQIKSAQYKESQYQEQQKATAKQIEEIEEKEKKEQKKCADSLVATQKTLNDLTLQVNEETKKMDIARQEGPQGNAPMIAEQVNKLWGDIKYEQKVQKEEQAKMAQVDGGAYSQVTDLKAQEKTFGLEAKMEAYLAGDIQTRTDKAIEHLTYQEKTPLKNREGAGQTEVKTKTVKTKHPKHAKSPK